jgi:hypothetical protein
MPRVKVIDTDEVCTAATRQREIFQGKSAERHVSIGSRWPEELLFVGKCLAQIYWSNKMLNGGEWETYKHIAEAGQDLFVNPKNTVIYDKDGSRVQFHGPVYEIDGPMPKCISELAQNKGLQVVLHDGEYYEIRLPKTKWGSGVHPSTGETFLVLYSSEGIHFLVTGPELDITKHGIVG